MTFLSYAQNFEDVLLWRALKGVRQGFYIDVGAQHPDVDSVTRAFYDRGWNGINVEPVPSAARRLREARGRDITLQLALGAAPGRERFFVVEGTGLSTLDPVALTRAQERGFAATPIETEVATLAEICRQHVSEAIHFLKIDVEGAEAAVLAGADFAAFRPWIVLVEATAPLSGEPTHATWEPGLLAGGYRFAWFDGLNRFYVAEEQAAWLLPLLQVPPNVGDDFLRAADTEWAGKLAQAEAKAEALERQLTGTERNRRASEDSAAQAHLLLATASARCALAEMRAEQEVERAARAEARAEDSVAAIRRSLEAAREETAVAQDWLAAMQSSSSWRVTAPLRRAGSLAARLRGHEVALPPSFAPPAPLGPEPAPQPEAEPDPAPKPLLGAVHQFHSGSATGDAVTQGMLVTRALLRRLGYRSNIFVEHRDPGLTGELRTMEELPRHADYVLIVHHSLGHHALDRILALPAPKVLFYHNITPAELLPPGVQPFARLGREQLARLARNVVAALANSEFSALELRAAGFDPVVACPLLFDVDALRAKPGRLAQAQGEPFTVLFVGRMIESKGQLELVEAFAEFNRGLGAPARLVLVGRNGGPEDPYCESVLEAIRRNQIDGQVTVAGPVSDAELEDWYGRADLYVSLSRHEGFGVPLVEAMARGVPVLAWPAGAVASTVGDGGELLQSAMPSAVAEQMLALARDPSRLRALGERGRRSLDRFAVDRQAPKLVGALARACAAAPALQETRDELARSLRYSITGHVNGSYSLAGVNTALALALEQERPGRIRLLPVEGDPTSDLSGVAKPCRAAVARLAGRPAFATGPEIVISQHYPVYPPPLPGDLPLALFFWEESLVGAETVATLNARFRGVLAPSRAVAKALIDSGVHVPVRVLPQAPRLDGFAALGRGRRGGEVFTFLHVSSCFPRKGVDVLLAAFARAFRAGDGVRLVIKGFPNIHNDVPEQVAALDRADPDHAEIRLINEDRPMADLLDLYREADAMVLPSRGEGFNLPAAEAMAAGVPLIVTGFGGHRDFCGPEEARLLAWRFAPSGSHLATPGSVWAEPDVDDLTAALRDAVADPQAAAARAERAQARIARETQPARTATALEACALDLLLARPRGQLRVAWVSSWDVRCGIAEYSRSLLDCLPRDGISELVILADERTGPRDVARPIWRSGDPGSMPALASAIAVEDPDVVVLQHQPGIMPWPGVVELLSHHALQHPVTLLILHNTAHLLDIPAPAREAVMRALSGCGRVLVHTVADLNRLASLGLVDNVALLPHGTPAPHPPVPSRSLTEADDVLIGSYGFFLPGKGLPELVRALAGLRRTWTRARLRLVNADYRGFGSAEEIASCKRLAEEAGLREAVEFETDFLPEERSLELLRACDLVVLPYQASKEASSAALRTALSAGLPVAVSPLPIFDEAADAVARLPGTDPDSIADGIAALLRSAEARTALTQAAQPWLSERAWPQVARRLAGMMRGLAAQRR